MVENCLVFMGFEVSIKGRRLAPKKSFNSDIWTTISGELFLDMTICSFHIDDVNC